MKNQYLGQLVVTEFYSHNLLKLNYLLGIVVEDDIKQYKYKTYRVQWLDEKDSSSLCTEDEVKVMRDRYCKYRQTKTGLFR